MRMRTLALLLVCAVLAGCWQRNVGRSYYASGQLKTEAAIKNNVLDGPAVMYYESGKKMSEATYRSGILDGKSISYYENGNRKAEAGYKDGVLHGRSASWAESGALQASATFADGRLVEPAPGNPPNDSGKVLKPKQ